MRPWHALVLPLFLLAGFPAAPAQESANHGAELARIKRILPPLKFFDDWLAKTKRLPPDFGSLRAQPFLPDPLTTLRGGKESRVAAADWPARRKEIADLTERWLLGHAPPPPGNVRAAGIEKSTVDGREVWKVVLEFGPNHAAKLHCTLHLPPGQKPAPVFLCDNAGYRSWAADAMGQGFAFCSHDARDRNDDSSAYADLFGDYDWAAFRRRGWSASRVVDWLETLDFIDKKKIIIGGHSRSAKSAMTAAAFDPRFAAVIASSPGSGGSMPYRYCDGSYFGESAEVLTRTFPDWVLQEVRFFSGRENLLPADSHFLYALIAPRPLLMSTAIHDWVEGTWSVEQVFRAVQPVYQLLGKGGEMGLRYRPGQHSTDAATTKDYSRFMLAVASGKPAAELFPFRPYHPWNYEAWEKANPPGPDAAKLPARGLDNPTLSPSGAKLTPAQWPARREEIRKTLLSLLGEGPAYEEKPVEMGKGETDEEAARLARDFPPAPQKTKVRFGDSINGNIYYPGSRTPGKGGKHPGIVFLGPLACSSGYTGSYRSFNTPMTHMELSARAGIVLAYDPLGTGGRQEERRTFYERHPRWSLMGKMVLDARCAVDALLKCPEVDPRQIYLVGYAMGGMVAAMTMALDDRPAGAVVICGFTPFRTDTDASGAGGVRRYSHLYGWMPALGAFVGREAKIPVDFPEILACAAPRPMLIVAPTLDWHAVHADVGKAVEQARKAYQLLGAGQALELDEPEDANRLTQAMHLKAAGWLKARAP